MESRRKSKAILRQNLQRCMDYVNSSPNFVKLDLDSKPLELALNLDSNRPELSTGGAIGIPDGVRLFLALSTKYMTNNTMNHVTFFPFLFLNNTHGFLYQKSFNCALKNIYKDSTPSLCTILLLARNLLSLIKTKSFF